MRFLDSYNQKKLKRAKLLDAVLKVVVTLFIGRRKHSPIPNPKKILVVQSHAIGDLVMTTPLLRALKKKYPDAQITLLANSFAHELLNGFEYVDRIVTLKFPWATYDYSLKNILEILKAVRSLRRENFDLAIDALIDMRNAFLMYLLGAKRRLGYDITGGSVFLTDIPPFPEDKENYLDVRLSVLEYLGINCSDKRTEIPVDYEAYNWVEAFLRTHELERGKIVAIHPGASAKEKLWNPEKFAHIINFLKNKGYQPVIIEGPKDEDIVASIAEQTGYPVPRLKTDLKKVAAFMNCSRLVICMDSAAIHIAGAMNVPAIALYGPKWPELTKPFNNNIEVLYDDSIECRASCKYSRCEDSKCTNAISVEAVVKKIENTVRTSDVFFS